MNSLNENSIKIKKRPRNTTVGDRNYICGGCQKSYKSYPALYLHIKRKHDGVRPEDTRTSKPISAAPKEKIHTGRPQKPSHDIDDINQEESCIEELQNDLLGFLGESVGSLATLEAKPKLENVITTINSVKNQPREEFLEQIKQESKVMYDEIKQKSPKDIDINIDYEEIKALSQENPLKVVVWFVLWLSRYNVKSNFVADLCIIFGKILKVLTDKHLEIPDLDNKLVWNGVMKEVEPLIPQFVYFNKDKDLILEFIKKVCHLIGKTFEEK